MDDFLAKPITPQALADILTKWLPQAHEPQGTVTPDELNVCFGGR